MNPTPSDARLINRLTMKKEDGSSSQWTATQKAQIGNKTFSITLHFDQFPSLTEAEKVMRASLEKVSQMVSSVTPECASTERVIHLKATPQYQQLVDQIEDVQSRAILKPSSYEFTFMQEPILSAVPSTRGAQGKTAEDRFQLKNGKEATETAVRADTVSTLHQSYKTKIDKLQKKLEADPGNERLARELQKTKADAERHSRRKGSATWGSTNSPRFAFREMGRRAAKASLAPIACNLRMQTVTGPDGKIVSRVTRSAALSDFSHGEVSLQELRDLKDLENWQKLPKERKTQLTKLYLIQGTETRNLHEVIREIKIKALVGYGLEGLAKDNPKNNRFRPILEKLQSADSITAAMKSIEPDTLEAMDTIEIDPEKLQEVVDQRSRHLKQMALQDLQLHLETKPAGNTTVLYCRTSVVDMQKPSKNEHGLVLDEKTQALDMKALFDELQGAELLFDCREGEAAYIDEEGKIHMPQKCAADGVTSAQLDTVFFNICTQGSSGHTLNSGMQKAINDDALEKLKKSHPDNQILPLLSWSLKSLETDPSQDPNDTVLLATLLVQEEGGYTGINCYGGKDRTGYAVALLTHHHLKKMDNLSSNSPAAKKWGHQLLSTKGVAAKIAEDNADHTVLKLSRKDLELYDISSLKGKMLRVAHAISGMIKGIVKIFKETLGLNALSTSKSEGQLYKRLDASRFSKLSITRKLKSLAKRIL